MNRHKKNSTPKIQTIPEAIVFKPVKVRSVEEIFAHQMNLRLPGYGWRVEGQFTGTWSLIADAQDQKTDLEANIARMVAEEVFIDMGLSKEDVVWGRP